ncbi:MAG TPA: agmatinase [Thermoleophilia bacterium]|nr:agmatinase [Thermoleophilia bacterium]
MTAPPAGGLRDKLVLLGICSDANSSFLRGTAEAPPLIRAALYNGSSNLTSETGVCFADDPRIADLGDTPFGGDDRAFAAIERHVVSVAGEGGLPLVLGGDHAITYPVVRALARQHGPLDILHFDAHPDLYDELDGNRLSHACPFARIMEEGLARRLVQVGIRTLNAPQRAQVERFAVEVHEMRSFDVSAFEPDLTAPAYVSFDMDALDPAFAPGVSHFEPGGLSTRDALTIIHRLRVRVVGADIVEYNPRNDLREMTAMVGAKLVTEIGGVMLRNAKAL